MKCKIKEVKTLDGQVKLVQKDDGKTYIQWSSDEGMQFLSDTKIGYYASKRGQAFEYKGEIIKECKTLFMMMCNEKLDAFVDSLPGRKVNMTIDYDF